MIAYYVHDCQIANGAIWSYVLESAEMLCM